MFSFCSFFLLSPLSCCALKEKGYFSLSIEQCEVIKLTVEGAPREFRINEECFHGMPLIHLLFLFYVQEALHGFHTLNLPDLCDKPCFGISAVHKTLQNNISLCCCHIDLKIMGVRVFDDYLIHFRGYARVIDMLACRSARYRGAARKQGQSKNH